MLKKIALPCFALLAALALNFATAQAKSLDDVIKDGTIRIGINPNFPPMSSRGSDGNWQGFDIDVGNKIAAALGVEAEFVPTETPQRVPFLVADKIATLDLANGLRQETHTVHHVPVHPSTVSPF